MSIVTPVSCLALAPFRLCSRSQPQSSPWDPTEAQASASSPHPSWRVSRQASQAGECRSAPILCAGICPLCPPPPCSCALFHGSEALPSATSSLPLQRGFLVYGKFSSFTAPSPWCRSVPILCLCFFFFILPYPGMWGVSCLLGGLGLLPAFSRCSVGVVPHVDVFLICLWGGR